MADKEQLAILEQGVGIWNKWREDNPDIKPDLSGVDLSDAYLPLVDLSGADLSGANLYWVYFYQANLSGADLVGADLTCSTLFKADLSGTDLRHARLGYANLQGAKVTQEQLDSAVTDGRTEVDPPLKVMTE